MISNKFGPRNVRKEPFLGTRYFSLLNKQRATNFNSVEHPFLRLSPHEEFIVHFGVSWEPLALKGNKFVQLNKDIKQMTTTLQLMPLDLSNQNETIKWLQRYKHITDWKSDGENLSALDEFTHKLPKTFVTLSKYPQLREIIDLFQDQEMMSISDPIALNSLMDYILLNDKAGLFAENIYLFLLQTRTVSIDQLNSIVGSITMHLDNKLDYFPDVEQLVSQILVTLRTLPSVKNIDHFDALFQKLLQKMTLKFTMGKNLSKFSVPLVGQLLEYHLFQTKRLIDCKILFEILFSKKVYPSKSMIIQYLDLLKQRTDTISTGNAHLQNMVYLSGFRPVIESKHPPEELLEFLIPLCKDNSDLKIIINIISQLDGKESQYLNRVSKLIISQFQNFQDKNVYTSMELISFLKLLESINKNEIPSDVLKDITRLLTSVGNYSMVAHLITKYNILQDTLYITQLENVVPSKDSFDKQKFLKQLEKYTER